MLIDNHQEVRSIILSILSKLTIIHAEDFGTSCFYLLRDLMKADKDLEIAVHHHIDVNIVQQLNKRPPKHINSQILEGLKELVSDTELHATKLMS